MPQLPTKRRHVEIEVILGHYYRCVGVMGDLKFQKTLKIAQRNMVRVHEVSRWHTAPAEIVSDGWNHMSRTKGQVCLMEDSRLTYEKERSHPPPPLQTDGRLTDVATLGVLVSLAESLLQQTSPQIGLFSQSRKAATQVVRQNLLSNAGARAQVPIFSALRAGASKGAFISLCLSPVNSPRQSALRTTNPAAWPNKLTRTNSSKVGSESVNAPSQTINRSRSISHAVVGIFRVQGSQVRGP